MVLRRKQKQEQPAEAAPSAAIETEVSAADAALRDPLGLYHL